MSWLWLFFASLFSVGGNLLIKRSSQGSGGTMLFLMIFGLGAGLFGVGLICYQRALIMLPLNIAYPVMVGTILTLASALSMLVFGERLNTATVLGMGLIFAGIVMLTVQPTVA